MIEINLLPWRNQLTLLKQQKMRHRLMVLILICIVICVIECACWLPLENHARKMTETAPIDTHLDIQDPWLNMAEQMTGQVNEFLTLWQKIHAIENNHIQFVKLTYANNKIAFVGNVNSFADLSRWVREMNSAGLHVMVQRLNKSIDTHQLRFFVLIQD